MKTLILGGVRSGKSRLAEGLARDSSLAVTCIVTARAGDDLEMAQRIQMHRQRRPQAWRVVEVPLHLAAALQAECANDCCVLLDCLTLWLTNLLFAEDTSQLTREIEALLALLPQLPGRLIFVANETSMGIVPLGELTRRFVDEAGVLHQRLAAQCDSVALTVAGLPLLLKGNVL